MVGSGSHALRLRVQAGSGTVLTVWRACVHACAAWARACSVSAVLKDGPGRGGGGGESPLETEDPPAASTGRGALLQEPGPTNAQASCLLRGLCRTLFQPLPSPRALGNPRAGPRAFYAPARPHLASAAGPGAQTRTQGLHGSRQAGPGAWAKGSSGTAWGPGLRAEHPVPHTSSRWRRSRGLRRPWPGA